MKASLQKSNWFCLLIGIIGGWVGGWWLGNQRVEKAVIEAYPEEVRPAVEAAAELLGEMDKEQADKFRRDMRSYGKQIVRENDLSTLFMALFGDAILTKLDEGDVDDARKFCERSIDNFRETFEGGMEIGEWQELADTLYARTSEVDSEDTSE